MGKIRKGEGKPLWQKPAFWCSLSHIKTTTDRILVIEFCEWTGFGILQNGETLEKAQILWVLEYPKKCSRYNCGCES